MKKLEDLFIPYELALELKELGFDGIGFFIYNLKNKLVQKPVTIPLEYCRNSYAQFGGHCTAPLWQQAFDFFREKYNLITCLGFQNDYLYSYEIYNIAKKDCEEYIDNINNYEKAQLECLKKLIEIVKQQKS